MLGTNKVCVHNRHTNKTFPSKTIIIFFLFFSKILFSFSCNFFQNNYKKNKTLPGCVHITEDTKNITVQKFLSSGTLIFPKFTRFPPKKEGHFCDYVHSVPHVGPKMAEISARSMIFNHDDQIYISYAKYYVLCRLEMELSQKMCKKMKNREIFKRNVKMFWGDFT